MMFIYQFVTIFRNIYFNYSNNFGEITEETGDYKIDNNYKINFFSNDTKFIEFNLYKCKQDFKSKGFIVLIINLFIYIWWVIE